MNHKKLIRIQIHDYAEKTCGRCVFNGIREGPHICKGCPAAEKLSELGSMLLSDSSPESKKNYDKNKFRNHIPHKEFVKLFNKKMMNKDIAVKLKCTLRTVGAHKKIWKEEQQKNGKTL